MTGPRLFLVDDPTARGFEPLSTARPVGELLYGCLTFRQRWERTLGLVCAGHLAGEELDGFDEGGGPPALSPDAVGASGPRWFVSSRFVPEALPTRATQPLSDGERTLTNDGRVVAVLVSGIRDNNGAPARIGGTDPVGETVEIDGSWIDAVWDLMAGNAAQTARDVAGLYEPTVASLPAGVEVLGPGAVSTGERILFEPGVVLDTRSGPIRIDDEVTIRAFTRIAGPSYLGPGSVVFGGNLSAVSLGPVCKVRGEIEESVIAGYSNKAHDGFLGHAYLGRWVNLGALTTNSDLKNNYGSVRLRLPDGDVDTGLSKVGCFLGDHVKTGIGTMLNTGTMVGVGSNVFGGMMPPTYVPPFSWGAGADLTTYRFDKFAEVAETVMARRDVRFTSGVRNALERVWTRSRGGRADS